MKKLITTLLFHVALLGHLLAYGELKNVQNCQGDFTLSTQAEVDAFTCTEVNGNLTISGNDITNLNGLSSLQKVSGKFSIENNNGLKSLDGLLSLESVGLGLYLINNPELSDLNALSSLKTVGDLTIDNSNIPNFNTLSSLTEISGLMLIVNNRNLFEIFGPPLLTSMQGGMSISGNGNLHAVRDFDNVTTITGGIHITENPNLIDIYGFSLLTSIKTDDGGHGHITIRKNDALRDIAGFHSLPEVGDVNIEFNGNLSAINVFRSLTKVFGHLNLSKNASLKYITGFNKLVEITGSNINTIIGITIAGSSIENLDWLASLRTISLSGTGGATTRRVLEIKDNALLSDISGLAGLDEQIINSNPLYITLTNNPLLTICEALGRYFKSLGEDRVLSDTESGIISISENGSGCTVEKILDSDPIGPPCKGDFILSSQAEVDAFFCLELIGNLKISGADITNLKSLTLLEKISGNLQITNNPNLETIDLPTLGTNIGSLSISNNDNLKSISGFNNVLHANSIYLQDNAKLESISGFSSLVSVEVSNTGEFVIARNDALTSLHGFETLRSTPTLRIVDNPVLLALDGFPSLTEVFGDFQISNNESLKTINGFNKLRGISGFPKIILNSALLIENNASLETLAGLSSLRFISAFLDGGHVPPIQGVVTVSVTGNPKLMECCSLGPLLYALVSEGAPSPFKRINISGNGGGCTQEDILNCEKICDGDVTLTSQAEVDAFNCTKVTGNLTVTGADITDLFGLSSLKEVYGHVRIENVNATSLHLSLLDSIGKAFFVMNNPSLARLGLSSTVREGIEISNNENLVQIGSSHELKKLGWLAIQNNPKLTSVFGFDSVETMEALYADPFGPAGIAIVNNDALTTMPDFQILKRVGSITITGNDQLTSLEGFPDVTQIEGVLTISDNSSLRAINGFENLESIVGISKHIPTGGLLIENNPLLEGFQGLSSLKEIRSDQWAEISINNNASLKNVDGLSSLTTFFALHSDKKLTIRNNAVLENIDSLSSLVNLQQGPGDTYINVTGNPKLTRCCGLKPMLDAISYYDPLSLHIDISQNGGGCTLQDILACTSQRILGYDIVDISGKFVRHLNEGDVLYLDDLKCKGQTIVATTTGEIGSVKFDLNNAFFMMQNASPYTLTGDNYGTLFKPWIPQAGAYAITATPYSEANAGGVAGQSLTIHITVKPGTAVVSYDIVNTSGTVLRHLNEGDILFLDDLKANGQTIVANITGEIGSVKFDLNNKFFMMQNASPYTLTGDNYGTYFQPWVPQAGTYTLTATPYFKPDAVGCGGQPLTIHFMVKPQSSTAVVSYDIVNTSGKIVRRLNEGDILYLHDLKGAGQTIVANTTGQIGSVKFAVNNAFFMMQNAFPYTLTGDNYGTYFKPWIPQAGAYAITARPYSKSDAGGVAGRSLTIHVTVVDKNKESVSSRIAGVGEEDSLQRDGISDVTIYPVPVDDELHVKIDDSADPEALVTIRNIHGLVIYHGSYSKSQEINTSQLRAGVYFLQITGEDGFLKSVKFMKE
ncbi:T9SS type A sorting domain-containing protein [Chryseolinea sp. H1M3-3]|uniref:T9SS type A sorting domain-containing protein n=1 Tax=Chryseolinea sp. H1M3-3 TaxID=3034144 RepID=UPI0023EDF3D3|nr:T9SS type A sorting domain-containing protein [Chryseolinea sp. H1M3-3]